MYETEYLRIWGLCLSIIVAIFVISSVYNFGGKRPIQKSIGDIRKTSENIEKSIGNTLKNDYRKYRRY